MDASRDLQGDPREQVQTSTREWIKRALERRGWTANRLAKEAGLAASTVHRALNDPRFVTSTTTLEKIATATGLPSPVQSGTGFAEADACADVAPLMIAAGHARPYDGHARASWCTTSP